MMVRNLAILTMAVVLGSVLGCTGDAGSKTAIPTNNPAKSPGKMMTEAGTEGGASPDIGPKPEVLE